MPSVQRIRNGTTVIRITLFARCENAEKLNGFKAALQHTACKKLDAPAHRRAKRRRPSDGYGGGMTVRGQASTSIPSRHRPHSAVIAREGGRSSLVRKS